MSVKTDLEYRTARLRGVLSGANTSVEAKGGAPAGDLSGLAEAIESIPDTLFQAKTVTPTGQEITVSPDEGYDGLSSVVVTGDINIAPRNIAAGVSLYGVVGTMVAGASASIPQEYQTYVDHALTLYTGEYTNVAIIEDNDLLSIVLLMSDFALTDYNATTEFKAQGWLSCALNKAQETWAVTDWRDTPSTGGNYVKNIRYSSVYWEYNGGVIWPVGAGGGGSSGGSSMYRNSAIEVWYKCAEVLN